jgi:hypothetical protein
VNNTTDAQQRLAGLEAVMSFLKQLFGRAHRSAPAASRMFTNYPADESGRRAQATDRGSLRRELLRTVLRKTLNRHGIPPSWIGAEMLVTTSRGQESGMHWRLLVKHWDPRLLTHSIALQNSLLLRLLNHDSTAADWLTGISWQFALADEAVCPPMPYPGFWTAEPAIDAEDEAEVETPGGSGDVIAGPVRITTPNATAAPVKDSSDSVRSDLDKLLAIRDAELKSDEERFRAAGLDATQPMYLKTEPAPLADRPPRRS